MTTYGSVCSGIEAATVAMEPLGWKAAWYAEIEAFPSAVLEHHYPDVPNLGDMTKIAASVRAGDVAAPDALIGGTPCQAFSVAGLRNSLADERGNLTLRYVELADAIDDVRRRAGQPEAVIWWENVPGVLSTKDNAFGCFLAGLAGEDEPLQPAGKKWSNAGCVYGPARAVAWRTLDAQYLGLAQRRRRVFVVASARDGFDPATVLFEWDSVRRDTPPRREAGQGATAGTGGGPDGGSIAGAVTRKWSKGSGGPAGDECPQPCCSTHPLQGDVAHSLRADGFDASEDGTGRGTPLVVATLDASFGRLQGASGQDANHGHSHLVVADTLRSHPRAGSNSIGAIAPTLRSMGNQGSHANAGGQVAIAVRTAQTSSNGWGVDEETAYTLDRTQGQAVAVAFAHQAGGTQTSLGYDPSAGTSPTLTKGQTPAVAFAENSRAELRLEGGDGSRCGTLSTGGGKPGQGVPMVAYSTKLHNTKAAGAGKFYEEYTAGLDVNSPPPALVIAMAVRRLTPRECERLQGFPDDYTLITYRNKPAADGPRYKSLGNSMAVTCMRWIGTRIDQALRRLA